jgi:hypothetical protein
LREFQTPGAWDRNHRDHACLEFSSQRQLSNLGSHLRDEFRESRKLLLDEIACDVVLDLAGCLVELGSAMPMKISGLLSVKASRNTIALRRSY